MRLVLEEDFDASGEKELNMSSREAANSKEKVSDLLIYP